MIVDIEIIAEAKTAAVTERRICDESQATLDERSLEDC